MIYDYIIIGGGPTGITLAIMLANTKFKTLLLESESSLGGNWKVDLQNEYLTEHSPKVLFSNNHYFFELLKCLKVKYKLNNVYGKFGNLKIINAFVKSFSCNDYYQLFKTMYKFISHPTSFDYYQSLDKWIIENNLSDTGKSLLETLSVVMANTSDKICMGSFMEFILIEPGIFFNIVQLNDPNEWLNCASEYLSTFTNINILYNTHIVSIHENGTMQDKNNNTFKCKEIILTVPVRSLYNIVLKSSPLLQKNWFESMNTFENFVDKSTYIGLGFQLHFNKKMIPPTDWCWSCFNDWKIIVVQKDDIHKIISKDPTIVSVWSCVIVDLESKSKRTKKTPNECDTMDEIVEEALYQLSCENNEEINPYKITYHKNIRKKCNKWDTINSSYANSIGALSYTGEHVNNIYSVGPHNIGSFTIIEHAIKSAIIFGTHKRINNIFPLKSKHSYLNNQLFVVISLIIVYIAIK